MKKLISWFDIPVSGMARAVAFYEHLTSQRLQHPVGRNARKLSHPTFGK